MKKIYEIPEVTIFEVGPNKQIMQASNFYREQGDGNALGNDNNLDDQSTPWYRR